LSGGGNPYAASSTSLFSVPSVGLPAAERISGYEEKVVPHLKRGEDVLVVCHQYVLEPLALYLSGLPPTAYEHLKLPNGKALSKEDLVNFRQKESSGSASLRKKINDLATMWGILLYAIAFLLGGLLKVASSSGALKAAISASIGILPFSYFFYNFYNMCVIDNRLSNCFYTCLGVFSLDMKNIH
jgi:hypothetical protein